MEAERFVKHEKLTTDVGVTEPSVQTAEYEQNNYAHVEVDEDAANTGDYQEPSEIWI